MRSFDFPPRLNNQYRVLYYPKPGLDPKNRRCFLIGVYQLPNYVGMDNAITILRNAEKSLEDKTQKILPSYGKVVVYLR